MKTDRKVWALLFAVLGLMGFDFPRLKQPQIFSGATPNRDKASCSSDLHVQSFSVDQAVDLSETLKLTLKLDKRFPAAQIATQKSFLYGHVAGKGGFLRPIENLAFRAQKSGFYQAELNLAQFANQHELWPAIAKAQSWDVAEVPIQVATQLIDAAGCVSETLVAESQLTIAGFDRNSALPGSTPMILHVAAPETIRLGDSLRFTATVLDADQDLASPTPVRGFLQVAGVPLKWPLPQDLSAWREAEDQWVVDFGNKHFAYYERWLEFLPLDEIQVSVQVFVEDNTGHRSEPYVFSMKVQQNSSR